MKTASSWYAAYSGMNVDELLEEIEIGDVDDHMAAANADEGEKHRIDGMVGYFHVSTPHEGVIAYFLNEVDAFRFRLDLINRIMNP